MDDHDGSEYFDPYEGYWEARTDPSVAEIREVCEVWLAYQRGDHGGIDPDDPHWWACDAVIDAEYSRIEGLSWRLILCLCSLVEPGDEVIGMIGAGPLESMIFRQGDHAMDLIEAQADRDVVLLEALSTVWAFTQPVRPRIESYLQRRGYRTP